MDKLDFCFVASEKEFEEKLDEALKNCDEHIHYTLTRFTKDLMKQTESIEQIYSIAEFISEQYKFKKGNLMSRFEIMYRVDLYDEITIYIFTDGVPLIGDSLVWSCEKLFFGYPFLTKLNEYF